MQPSPESCREEKWELKCWKSPLVSGGAWVEKDRPDIVKNCHLFLWALLLFIFVHYSVFWLPCWMNHYSFMVSEYCAFLFSSFCFFPYLSQCFSFIIQISQLTVWRILFSLIAMCWSPLPPRLLHPLCWRWYPQLHVSWLCQCGDGFWLTLTSADWKYNFKNRAWFPRSKHYQFDGS